ncbi:MAG: 5-formyltetrahydrofolate cyclo-ligase, partial [Actinobacteria bacterium]|nr:5-formyltetrahydrofolate cyclo-ligase [Actinomycetota bacterium]
RGASEKRRVRATVRASRAALDEEAQSAARADLTQQLCTLVHARGARRISCYLPVGAEPDTRPFLAWAREQGIEALLPSVRSDGLMDWIRDAGDDTVTGIHGIPEPRGERPSPPAVGETDLMLIPACAVDLRGTRLGWGRGYFDRCLEPMTERPPVFAVVYDDEVLDALPREAHDAPVTGAVTPQRILYLDR